MTLNLSNSAIFFLADLIAGRPQVAPATANEELERQSLPITDKDAVIEIADTFFRELNVTDKASYLDWVAAARTELREHSELIRSLKAQLRPLDGNSSAFWELRKEIMQARARFNAQHAARRFGKAWAGHRRAAEHKDAVAA